MKPTVALRDAVSLVSLLRQVKGMQGVASSAELVDMSMECPGIRPQQIRSEFLELAELVESQQYKYVLEIGTYRGGTLFVFSHLAASDAVIVSVDCPFSLLGKVYRRGQDAIFNRFVRKGQSLSLVRADSHKPETLAKVQKVLEGNKLDFLFIDGDHRYEGVREDFQMYSPLVRSGGLIAFHDIARTKAPDEVYKFWDEIKPGYLHKEFVHKTGTGAMGIGVLWV